MSDINEHIADGIAYTLDADAELRMAREYEADAVKAEADGIPELASLWRSRGLKAAIRSAIAVAHATQALALVGQPAADHATDEPA